MAIENKKKGSILNFIYSNIMAVMAIVVVLMLVVPLPKFLIDTFMILNLALSVVILLVVIYTPRPSAFSSFPQVILFATIFGLGINISSTRLILTANGSNPNQLASTQSSMVQAFADIVTGGNNIIIGFVIFIIIIVVQVVVITKGASRVSEVAARFTLDAMSTKSFDIDNQLSQGYITEDEAKKMKEELRSDIDFYSNMDGSSKFVSGNVKAGIFITIINLIGGFAIGMLKNHLSFSESLSIYANLTIGDGLLSQLPSLMLSFATGILVTGDKSDVELGERIIHEFSVDGTIYEIVGVFLCVIGVALRNGTQFLLIPIGGLFIFVGIRLARKKDDEKKIELEKEVAEKNAKKNASGSNPEKDSFAPLDPLSLELGYGLIPLVEKENGAELLERITRIRKETALDLGLSVPSIHVMDNINIPPNEYIFKIRGIEAGSYSVRPGYYMCMNAGSVTEEIKGEPTKDPAFGMPAIWVPEDQRFDAEQAGYAVVDSPTIIATHITEIIRSHASEILGRQEVAAIIEATKKTNPIIVEEVMNGNGRKFSYGDIEKVLKALLAEQVSIRDIVTILETLSNFGSVLGSTWDLVAKVREALGKQICMQYVDEANVLHVYSLSQGWSQKFLEHTQVPADGSKPYVAFDPVDGRKWIKSASDILTIGKKRGFMPIIMCSSLIRLEVKSSLERDMPGVVVLSEKEILAAGAGIKLEVLGEITDEEGN